MRGRDRAYTPRKSQLKPTLGRLIDVEPFLKASKHNVRFDWIEHEFDEPTDGLTVRRLHLTSMGRQSGAEQFFLQNPVTREIYSRRKRRNKLARCRASTSFLNDPEYRFSLYQRAATNSIFYQLVHTVPNEVQSVTVLLDAVPSDEFNALLHLSEAYRNFLKVLSTWKDRYSFQIAWFSGFMEANISVTQLDRETKTNQFVYDRLREQNKKVQDKTNYVIIHAHLLISVFDINGIWPAERIRKVFVTDYKARRAVRVQELGTRSPCGTTHRDHLDRAAAYCIKRKAPVKGTTILERALPDLVVGSLPNIGHFEFVQYGRQRVIGRGYKFFLKRDFVLKEKMPLGFIGYDDNLEELISTLKATLSRVQAIPALLRSVSVFTAEAESRPVWSNTPKTECGSIVSIKRRSAEGATEAQILYYLISHIERKHPRIRGPPDLGQKLTSPSS